MFNTDTFFLTTKTISEFCEFKDMAILSWLPTKSLTHDVKDVALSCLLSFPTPILLLTTCLPTFLYVMPTILSSIRSCVCCRRLSVIPARSITTLYPASAALQIRPEYVAVLPDWTSPITSPFLNLLPSNSSFGFPRQFMMLGKVSSSKRFILLMLKEGFAKRRLLYLFQK